MSWLTTAACLALLASACQAQPTPTPTTTPTPTVAPVASIEITPSGALLGASGETKALTAVAHAADGTVVEAAVTWSTTDAAVATVDPTGTVTAVAATGTVQVTAAIGDVRSAPAYVSIAEPVAGAVLVTDAQIISGPVAVDPDGGADPDAPYEVVLRDAPGAVEGAILIGSEAKPIAGRVVSVAPEGADSRVRVVVVPPGELFEAVDFRDTVDLATGEFTIPEELAAAYDVTRTDGTFAFTPKTAVAPGGISLAGWRWADDAGGRAGLAAAVGTRALPPFSECEVEPEELADVGVPIGIDAPPTFTFTPAGTATREVTPNGTRMTVRATPTFKIDAAFAVRAAFEATLECKVTLVERTWRVPGWLGVFFGGDIGFGFGFEIGGEVTLAAAKLGGQIDLLPVVEASLDCPATASCSLSGDASGTSTLTPVFEAPNLNQAAFEPSAFFFGFIKLEAGNADIERLQFEAIEAKAGLELSVSLTLEGLQIDNTDAEDGRSKYGLAFKAEIGPGIKLGDLLEYLGVDEFVPLQLEYESSLGESPVGSVRADRARYLPGEEVKVTVTLAQGTTLFPAGVGPYNVKTVVVARRDGLGLEILAEQDATGAGDTTFDFVFTAGALIDADELFGFVRTHLLSLPRPLLEIGPAAVPILFTFDEGREGWVGGGRGPRSSTAEWGVTERRLGAMRLSGVGGAGRPNSWIKRDIAIPADATTLSFKASADLGHAFANSSLTVKIVTGSGSTTLLTKVYTNTTARLLYTKETLDISAFAGTTVTIVFEQDDTGDGQHEHIYLDDIEIGWADS